MKSWNWQINRWQELEKGILSVNPQLQPQLLVSPRQENHLCSGAGEEPGLAGRVSHKNFKRSNEHVSRS